MISRTSLDERNPIPPTKNFLISILQIIFVECTLNFFCKFKLSRFWTTFKTCEGVVNFGGVFEQKRKHTHTHTPVPFQKLWKKNDKKWRVRLLLTHKIWPTILFSSDWLWLEFEVLFLGSCDQAWVEFFRTNSIQASDVRLIVSVVDLLLQQKTFSFSTYLSPCNLSLRPLRSRKLIHKPRTFYSWHRKGVNILRKEVYSPSV